MSDDDPAIGAGTRWISAYRTRSWVDRSRKVYGDANQCTVQGTKNSDNTNTYTLGSALILGGTDGRRNTAYPDIQKREELLCRPSLGFEASCISSLLLVPVLSLASRSFFPPLLITYWGALRFFAQFWPPGQSQSGQLLRPGSLLF